MAQNDFLQFDENNENVLTQDAYREDEQRKSGAKSGVARSSLFNKVLRQVSTFVAGFGQFISEKNINVLEDIDSVKNALTNVLSSKNIGVSTEVQSLLGVDNVDDGLKNIKKIIPYSAVNIDNLKYASDAFYSESVSNSVTSPEINTWHELRNIDVVLNKSDFLPGGALKFSINGYARAGYNFGQVQIIAIGNKGTECISSSVNLPSPSAGTVEGQIDVLNFYDKDEYIEKIIINCRRTHSYDLSYPCVINSFSLYLPVVYAIS